MKLTNQTFTEMADSINADLAKESKREAKGVSWDLHQRECDRNEALEYEIETLKAKVADLENSVKKHKEHASILAVHMSEASVLDKTDNTLAGIVDHCLESVKDWSVKWRNIEAGTL